MSPEEVREALSVRCEMCGAEAGAECLSIIDNKPLPFDRPTHYYRRDPMKFARIEKGFAS